LGLREVVIRSAGGGEFDSNRLASWWFSAEAEVFLE
jgi:hypothetical protein